MNPRKIVTWILWLFIGVSVVAMIVNDLRRAPPNVDAAAESSGPAAAASRPDRVVLYYFQGKVRCPACRNVEAYAREAVETGFAEQLKDGRVEWKAIDYEAPGNEHFASDYQLVAASLVLVEMRDAAPKRWKNLQKAWELADNKQALVAMVQDEIRSCPEAR